MSIAQTIRSQFAKAGLTRGARKDPELYPLFFIMGLIAAPLVGWNFPRQVSSATSENKRINVVPGSAPYETGDANGGYKFKYHPTGDRNVEPRESPAALNAVIVPDLNLPKAIHERFNKFGKAEFGV